MGRAACVLVVAIACLLAPVVALHDGRFARQDPWRQPNLFDELRHGVLLDIWPSIVFHVAVAVAVNLINNYQTVLYVGIPSTMLTVLGTVIGFTVNWRTHSAYNRFLEGAHLWGDTIANARTWARLVWFHVPSHKRPIADGSAPTEAEVVECLIEKRTMINLTIAYHVALKHYLRGESGPLYEDLYHLTCHLPKYTLPTSIPIVRADLGPDANAHHLRQHPSDNDLARKILRGLSVSVDVPGHHHERQSTGPVQSEREKARHDHHHHEDPAIRVQSATPATPAHIPLRHAATIGATTEHSHLHGAHHRHHLCDKLDCTEHMHPHHSRHHAGHPASLSLHSHEHVDARDAESGCVVCAKHVSSGHSEKTLVGHDVRPASPSPSITKRDSLHVPARSVTMPVVQSHADSLPIPMRPTLATHGSSTSVHSSVHNLRSRHGSTSTTGSAAAHGLHGPRHPPQPLLPAQNPPRFSWTEDWFPVLIPLKMLYRWLSGRYGKTEPDSSARRDRKNRMRRKFTQSDNLPLEITLYFSAFIATLQRRQVLDVPTCNAMLASVAKFSSDLTALEKIISTPLPLAYRFHLEHATTIYLLFLPFQLEPILGWTSPLAVGIAAFLFLGFLAIGEAIQSPFGYDRSDLDLDDICRHIIVKELNEICAHPPATVDQFIFVPTNEPLAPSDFRSASQLVSDGISLAELEAALRKGHEADRGWRGAKVDPASV